MRSNVEDIKRLYELCTPPAVIAERLHLPEAVVCYALRYGELPPSELHWKELQPNPENRVSDR